MKGLLRHAPTPEELERLYHELAAQGAPAVGRRAEWPYAIRDREHLLALACDMLRYDPRLLSILLHWFLERWESLDLHRVRSYMRQMRWPQALLVLASFARQASPGDAELRYATDYLAAGWTPVDPPERFFFDVERPGSRRAERRQGRSLDTYSKWGFFGTERPAADVFQKRLVGRYDQRTRRQIAREMATRGDFSISEYLDAVERSVSRPQARADLRSAGLVLRGQGRGARWSSPDGD